MSWVNFRWWSDPLSSTDKCLSLVIYLNLIYFLFIYLSIWIYLNVRSGSPGPTDKCLSGSWLKKRHQLMSDLVLINPSSLWETLPPITCWSMSNHLPINQPELANTNTNMNTNTNTNTYTCCPIIRWSTPNHLPTNQPKLASSSNNAHLQTYFLASQLKAKSFQ